MKTKCEHFCNEWADGWLGIARHTLYQLGAFGSVLKVGGKRVLAGRVLDRRDGSLVDNGGLVLCGIRHGDCVVSKRCIVLFLVCKGVSVKSGETARISALKCPTKLSSESSE